MKDVVIDIFYNSRYNYSSECGSVWEEGKF